MPDYTLQATLWIHNIYCFHMYVHVGLGFRVMYISVYIYIYPLTHTFWWLVGAGAENSPNKNPP